MAANHLFWDLLHLSYDGSQSTPPTSKATQPDELAGEETMKPDRDHITPKYSSLLRVGRVCREFRTKATKLITRDGHKPLIWQFLQIW